MLAIPVKACVVSSADVLPKLRAALLLEQNPAETDQLLPRPDRASLEKELSRFINLREDARRVEIQAVRSDPNVEAALVRYSAALCHAKVALGASLDENMAFRFMWRDAFKPAVVAHSRSVSFERCCSLYNLGALFSQRAALVNRNDLAGVRDAKDGFQCAAGVFDHVKALLGEGGFRALGVQTNAPPPPQGAAVGQGVAAAAGVTDLSAPGLDMAMALMLAQAQACCYEEALKGGSQSATSGGSRDPAVIAQLAAGAAAMYSDALACVHASPQLVELDNSWQRHMHFQSACFEAVACWWRAKELATAVGSGEGPSAQEQQQERVGRLRAAIAACDRALAPPPNKGAATSANDAHGGLAAGLAAQAQGLKSMATQELVQAQLASAGLVDDDGDDGDNAATPPPLPALVVRRAAEPMDIGARLAHAIADEQAATAIAPPTLTGAEEGYSAPAASSVVEGLDLLDNFTLPAAPNAIDASTSDATTTDEPLPLKGLLSRSLRAAATDEWATLATAAQKSSHAALALGTRGRAALEPKRMATEAFAMSQGRVPDGLWERVAKWQASGGEEALRKQVQMLDTVATEAKARMDSAQKVLEAEEGASARFLSLSEACGDSQRINLCGSAGTALQTLGQRLKKLQIAWGVARESDAKLATTLADASFVEGAKLLNLGREDLAREAAAAQANDRTFAAQVATAQAAAAMGSSATAFAAVVPSAVESDALRTSLLDGREANSPTLAPGVGTTEHADRVAALTSAVDAAAIPLTRALVQTASAFDARDASAQALAAALPAKGGSGTEALVTPLWRAAAAMMARPAITGSSRGGDEAGSTALLDTSSGSMNGTEAVSPREAVKIVLAPLHARVTALDTALNAPVSPGDSLDADGLARGEPLLSRAGQEALLASIEALATRFNEALFALREVSGDPGSSSSRLAAVLEHALTASSAARAQLEQGERWYADLASRLSAVAAEIEDHAFAQEVLRKDFGVASQQEDDDEALARRLQRELAEEEDASNAVADAEASAAPSPPLPPPSQPPQQQPQPQQQQAAAADGRTQLATKVPEGVGPGGRIKITLPGSGKEIELVVPEGMASGEMLEFLVPNSLLRPPDAHLNDIVIVNKRQAEQAATSNAASPPVPSPQSQLQFQPPPSQQPQQPPPQPLRHAPPARPHPPSFGNTSGGSGNPASPHSGMIPDYSQSARTFSSEPHPAADGGGVKETAEKAWANISSGFSGMFGGSQSAYPARPQQTPLVDTRSNEVAGVPRFTPQQAPSRTAPTRKPTPEPEVTVDSAVVAQLKDMGFAEDVVVAALIANRGDAERALNTLLTADETAALSASMS